MTAITPAAGQRRYASSDPKSIEPMADRVMGKGLVMAQLFEDTQGKIRDRPIAPRLKALLLAAAESAGIEVVRVTSGGQARLGTPGKRTGSTRHDDGNAADLMLQRGGRTLAFTNDQDLRFFEDFVAQAVANGATGVGAGVDYMGPRTIHVGFGAWSVWGAKGKSANAPSWLVRAANRGRGAQGNAPAIPPPNPTVHDDDRQYVVVARSGLKLRAGPGTQFSSTGVLPRGTRLAAVIDQSDSNWARVDLQGDGLFDGYVFAAYISRT